MAKSLCEQLPSIFAAGKRQAAQILEQLEGQNKVSLQTRELVIPSKDKAGFNLWSSFTDEETTTAPNRLIFGDESQEVQYRKLDYARLRRSSTARQEKLL